MRRNAQASSVTRLGSRGALASVRLQSADEQFARILRIDANHLAVASALGHDYKITLKPFDFAPVVSDTGEGWQYLGAFDFAFPPKGKPRLMFFDPRVAECIPMGTVEPSRWADKPRPQARQASCPSPSPEQGVQ